MKFHILLLTLPLCLGQFSIQGPSDGNRQAQGLKYSSEKGIEYTDQSASLGAGDFSIQGASDGNSDFRIQGPSDGHSQFQIQGASDGNAQFRIQGATDSNAQFHIQGPTDANAEFRIQGATDAHSQSFVREPYDANQGDVRSLQYNDPSGLRVNWRTFGHDRQAQPAAQQQYVAQPAPVAAAPRRRPSSRSPLRSQQAPQQQQLQSAAAPVQQASYTPYESAPPSIKDLLKFQAQIPYLNVIPEHLRYDALAAQQAQAAPPAPVQYQNQASRSPAPASSQEYRPNYRGKSRGSSRAKRQAQRGQQQGGRQPYAKYNQPPAEPTPQYSPNAPSGIQQLLKFQSQIPYLNGIPEQFRFDVAAAQRAHAQELQNHFRNRARRAADAQSGVGSRIARQAQGGRQHQQPQYSRISAPPAEPAPQYSTNVPAGIQQLLKFQAQIPHQIIANQIQVRLDKPYVPQPVQQRAPAAPQYQQPQQQQQAQPYQGQYQNQVYQNQGNIRPVQENQY